MAPEPGRDARIQTVERGAEWALLPVVATVGFYALPQPLQESVPVQCIPQLLAYFGLALWAASNSSVSLRLGLSAGGLRDGLRWGTLTGLVLGILNCVVILAAVPAAGFDIQFLKDTPHARPSPFVMVPWGIGLIAVFVEVNFRGFLLGRLAVLEAALSGPDRVRRVPPVALLISALTFAFDPFMVDTFRHLHWIAVWDGLIWGVIWIRTRNVFITIVAHTVEVVVMYLTVRTALG